MLITLNHHNSANGFLFAFVVEDIKTQILNDLTILFVKKEDTGNICQEEQVLHKLIKVNI